MKKHIRKIEFMDQNRIDALHDIRVYWVGEEFIHFVYREYKTTKKYLIGCCMTGFKIRGFKIVGFNEFNIIH